MVLSRGTGPTKVKATCPSFCFSVGSSFISRCAVVTNWRSVFCWHRVQGNQEWIPCTHSKYSPSTTIGKSLSWSKCSCESWGFLCSRTASAHSGEDRSRNPAPIYQLCHHSFVFWRVRVPYTVAIPESGSCQYSYRISGQNRNRSS